MSEAKTVGTEDPEYYAELLYEIRRPADRRLLPSNERLCSFIPSIHWQNVDDPLAQCLQTLLDTVADISLCQRGNVSATTACLKKDHEGTLHTQLYIVFNHDDAAARCSAQHLQHIFNMLRQVPYKPLAADGSTKIANELENKLVDICKAIHDYSFDIFAYRVIKRKHELSVIRGYIEQDRTYFTSQDRSKLVGFLDDIGTIVNVVTSVRNTKQLPAIYIQFLTKSYSFWVENDLLPDDLVDDNKPILLDAADKWLTEVHHIGFQLRRWAIKIMSFVISANRLLLLTQSHRLRKLIEGKFSVWVLTSPSTTPYCCSLSSETVQQALDAALTETEYHTDDWAEARESFIEQFPKEQDVSTVEHRNPTVHAELAMVMAMVNGDIKDVFPYIGVSKLSCIMCSHYIRAFNEITQTKIAIKGCHEKAYPGWSWPSLPSRDGELRPAFLKRIRQQLASDFEHHARRRLSDSSVGSGGQGSLRLGETREQLDDFRERVAQLTLLGI